MYNILITDDEQIVIDSLKMILNRNFGDSVSLHWALSGHQALDIVHSVKIDIVFMDVHMPGINGLETISLIKQINPNVVIIILSAYDQFQYAQEALNLGAYKYLTKPVNRNLIIQTVQNAFNIVDSQRLKLNDNVRLHEKLNLVSSMVESDFIYSCIFNNKNTDFDEYLSYFGIDNDNYCMCCIEALISEQEKRPALYDSIRDVLVSKCRCIVGSFMGNRICAFFPLPKNPVFEEDEGRDYSYQNVLELFNSIYSILTIKVSSSIRIGVSGIESSVKNSQTAYSNALSALNLVPLSGGIKFFEKIEHGKADPSKAQNIRSRLYARIKAGDSASVRLLSSAYIETLFNTFEENHDRIKNSLFESLIAIKNIVVTFNPDYKNMAFENLFSSVSELLTHTDYEKFFNERCMECVTAINQSRKDVENPVIKKACEYIEKHLSENIDLEQLSGVLQVSPYYLSKLFKEVKNENYINYLTSLRLEKAKKLLEDDSLIIKQITASVGYNDQNYFSKLFKQKFGMTPTEYRENFIKGIV